MYTPGYPFPKVPVIQVYHALFISTSCMPQYFYAVANGRHIGVFRSLNKFQHATHKFPHARGKRFRNLNKAVSYVKHNTLPRTTSHKLLPFVGQHTASSILGVDRAALPSANEAADSQPGTTTTTARGQYVYTDGSCLLNGQEGASAGIGVYFGSPMYHHLNMSLPIAEADGGAAELRAVQCAMHCIRACGLSHLPFTIMTDSQYVIEYMTRIGKQLHQNSWKRDVRNRSLVRNMYYEFVAAPNLSIQKVKAHTQNTDLHSVGNREAHRLAQQAAKDIHVTA